jgi:hypothetical protein
MSIDLAELKTEIAGPAYAGMDEIEIADALKASTIPADRDVPVIEARKIVLPTGELAKIKVLAETRPVDGPAASAIVAAITFAETMADRESVIPASAKSQVDTMLTGLVAANVLSGPSKAALLALFETQISRAEQMFGLGVVVQSGDVSRAKLA